MAGAQGRGEFYHAAVSVELFDKAAEMEVLSAVVLREELLARVKETVLEVHLLSDPDCAVEHAESEKRLVGFMSQLRAASVRVVEGVQQWRKTMVRPVVFRWRRINYLLKISGDLDFLKKCSELDEVLGYRVGKRNPFGTPHAGLECRRPSKALVDLELGPIPGRGPLGPTLPRRGALHVAPEDMRRLRNAEIAVLEEEKRHGVMTREPDADFINLHIVGGAPKAGKARALARLRAQGKLAPSALSPKAPKTPQSPKTPRRLEPLAPPAPAREETEPEDGGHEGDAEGEPEGGSKKKRDRRRRSTTARRRSRAGKRKASSSSRSGSKPGTPSAPTREEREEGDDDEEEEEEEEEEGGTAADLLEAVSSTKRELGELPPELQALSRPGTANLAVGRRRRRRGKSAGTDGGTRRRSSLSLKGWGSMFVGAEVLDRPTERAETPPPSRPASTGSGRPRRPRTSPALPRPASNSSSSSRLSSRVRSGAIITPADHALGLGDTSRGNSRKGARPASKLRGQAPLEHGQLWEHQDVAQGSALDWMDSFDPSIAVADNASSAKWGSRRSLWRQAMRVNGEPMLVTVWEEVLPSAQTAAGTLCFLVTAYVPALGKTIDTRVEPRVDPRRRRQQRREEKEKEKKKKQLTRRQRIQQAKKSSASALTRSPLKKRRSYSSASASATDTDGGDAAAAATQLTAAEAQQVASKLFYKEGELKVVSVGRGSFL